MTMLHSLNGAYRDSGRQVLLEDGKRVSLLNP
jgi:hypothetical protein